MVVARLKAGLKMAVPATVFAMLCTSLPLERSLAAQTGEQKAGEIRERIVQVQTNDNVTDAGALFTPPKNEAKEIAVIWVHGATINFYSPTYVAISRALANRGFTVVTGNTRMHDLGNDEAWPGGKRIRGGTYWGIPSEQVRDIAAWIDFAQRLGFKHVVLVGHSAGANAAREYQAKTQDPRVAGLVLASGDVRPDTRIPPPEWVSKAKQDISDGKPEELVQGPFLSAGTFLDLVNRPPGFKDFFGALSNDAGVSRIQCPLLVLLGTDGDVGNEEDLKQIKASIERLPTHPSRVDTSLIQGADHMYDGHEDRVAQVIASWSDTLLSANAEKGGAPNNP
ncbi:alpha/beta hydrolase [Acidicapsa dinghuensis]|uniref:Alpha/beta hydrolase n=1 Tax=Acidicapsa dinghuensis TaxID=2218256 RepID=A0ABW1EDT5_9BACT|nr:alpha/beta hydrolase [Acidicapsa dinghuensis]